VPLRGFAEDADKFGGGVRQTGAAARDQVDMARHVHLPHFYFLHPAVLDFPLDTHSRDDGYTHTHLHEALDAFDGGHFDGHFQFDAVSGKKFDDTSAERGFHAVGDEVFVAQVGDVDFALLCKRVFRRNDESELVFTDFGGLELWLLRNVGNGADVQAIIKDFVRNVAGEHAMDTDQDAGMELSESGEGRKKGVDGAFVYAERELSAL
jgi:hypothetical protein